ncbi:carboxypeptidase regulatory-like domain-containing protein [Silvibacterium sp.]|uniref:TonB-dependent receptor n=1 Tax=Silvibacterium sp. TaxID=1964179 RepID=UPI0039E61D38
MSRRNHDLRAAALALSLFAGVFTVLSPQSLWSQTDTGQIAGKVTDPTGALIPGGTVVIKNLSTNAERTLPISPTGTYISPGLLPGTYQITITATGFQPFTGKVELTVGGHATLDAGLSVTQATSEVRVIGAGGVELNSQTQELSQVVDSQQLTNLPSLTRNPYDFVVLSGNVSAGDNTTNSSNSGQNLTNRGVGVAINGQRESGTEILLDGVENVSIFGLAVGEDIPIDAVQEYSVITNNFSPEYGRASGGVVNVTTKSGSNNFHGSAWGYNRLSAYTANTYANDAANAAAGSIVDPKGSYTRNQFGFQVGGPIFKNKLFFMGSSEWTRVRSSATEAEEVLDPAFIALLPSNAQAYFTTYGTGAVASSGVAATAGQLQAAGVSSSLLVNGTTLIPAATPVFDKVSFQAPFDAGGGVPENAYDLVIRGDYQPTDKTQMFFRAGRENINQFTGSAFYSAYPQYDAGTTYLNQSYLYSLSHSFNAFLLNNVKASFTRYNENTSFDTSLTDTPSLFFSPPTDPVTSGDIQFPGLENSGDAGEGGLPYGGPQNTIQLEDDLALIKGAHSFKFGGQFTYIQLNQSYGAYAQANEVLGTTFADSFNDLLNTAGAAGGSTLTTFAARVDPQGKLPCETDVYGSLIETSACAVTPPLSSAAYARSYRYDDWALYAQDSWKATPRLTLNYGVRYEHYGVQHNNHPDLDSNFYEGAGSTLEEQVASGQVDIANQSPIGSFWAPSWGSVGPRVGFAYDIHGDGRTVVRGGFGISYERNFGNVTYNASFNPPASAVLQDQCTAQSASCSYNITNNNLGPLGTAGPTSYLPPAELRAINPNIHVAATQFYSLAVGQQLGPHSIVELSYSGAHGVHLYDIQNVNGIGAAQAYLGAALVTEPSASGETCPYENLATGAAECLTRPNSQYAAINSRGSGGSSSYDALNLKFQTQNILNSGVTIVANYTMSHSLDDISSTFGDSLQGGSGDIGTLGYTSLTNPMLDWGSSDFDIRHRFVLSPIWSTPWYKTQQGVLGRILGGYTFTTIYTARTGIPFSIYDYSTDEFDYTVPRLIPATPIVHSSVAKSPTAAGANVFNALSIPLPENFDPLNSTLGISDYGPFPSNMTRRNSFRGPGAWNDDASISKSVRITEGVRGEFRAEAFDLFNHHNYYVNTTNLYYDGPQATPLQVTELKGGLGSLATGGNHDERRFGQFSLAVKF